MRVDERAVLLCAALLPASTREIRREEWLADLHGAESLGLRRADIVLAAVTYAASRNAARTMLSRITVRGLLIGAAATAAVALVAVPGVALAAFAIDNARGITTVETAADGSERTVHWRDYPGSADIDTEQVLDGPTLEEGLREGEEMSEQIRAALTAEFGLEWVPSPEEHGDGDDPFVYATENRYGGESMLKVINSPTSQSSSIPSEWAQKQRIISIISTIAAEHGFSEPVFDHDQPYVTPEDRVRNFGGATAETQVLVSAMMAGPSGQWLSFSLQDMSNDVDGAFAERNKGAIEYGWQANTVTIMYGANGLLPENDRDEFLERLRPFEGLEHQEPQVS